MFGKEAYGTDRAPWHRRGVPRQFVGASLAAVWLASSDSPSGWRPPGDDLVLLLASALRGRSHIRTSVGMDARTFVQHAKKNASRISLSRRSALPWYWRVRRFHFELPDRC